MSKNIVVGIVALLVGFSAGYMWPGRPAGMFGGHDMMNGSMMGQNIDQHFIVQMIPHHEGAISMAQVALERSRRPEILSLAKGIIEAQELENKNMRVWYQEWFGAAPPADGMGSRHLGSMSGDLTELKAAPADQFDRVFLTQMIPHHEMAIMMAQMLQAATTRPELKELADAIITSQSREIKMMESWLNSW